MDYVQVVGSNRFVKKVQWEGWRAKRILVSGSKHRESFCGVRGYDPQQKFELVCAKSCNPVHFGPKMVRNAVNNAFLKHFNNGNGVPTRFALEMTPGCE